MPTKPILKGRDYKSRNYYLKKLGFDSYKEYLKSSMWQAVREMIFNLKGRACLLCGKPATSVHHNRYHIADLTGARTKFLVPICYRCHKGIEFDSGAKNSLTQAQVKYSKGRRQVEHLKRVSEIPKKAAERSKLEFAFSYWCACVIRFHPTKIKRQEGCTSFTSAATRLRLKPS